MAKEERGQRPHPGHPLDWNLLRTFIAIVQEGSITKAGLRLSLTQPAVSLALKRLEDRLGLPLIDRGAGRFAVTAAGARVYDEAVAIHGAVSRLDTLVHETQDDISGHVRLLMTSRIQTDRLDRSLRDFHRRHPTVTFRIDVMESAAIHIALLQRTGAMALCLLREPIPGLSSVVFLRQTYRLYCGPDSRLFGRRGLDVADVRHEDFVSFTSDQIDGVLLPLTLFRAREGFAGRIVASSGNLDEVRRMIVCGLGIGPLPDHIAARDVADGLLWELPPYDGVAPVDVHLMWNSSAKLNRAERALLDCLCAVSVSA
ncbi:LysR family transcriptional regulator [Azospirillum griseum]|uniref:LysR family transcriptional regulator n=1 Tax=Azospirillum griseum TaxID=2496639 RepID=A0A431VE39_9PROT|nr:LysR family transcriptional regulator [Azospirillum griseum]RTR17628.1 LysR family transcriptional regulator [Azospirillum griseum]